jgi:RimJ/RimL family protein N-acetyltransferase
MQIPFFTPLSELLLQTEGAAVRLCPLNAAHFPSLIELGADPRIWTDYPLDLSDAAQHLLFLQNILAQVSAGTCMAFVILWGQTERIVGMTRLYHYQKEHRQAEIGSWLAPAYWKSGINRISKLLLLHHCFEVLGLIRVQFKTDVRNQKSRTALEKLGAKQEGIIRKERILENGQARDAVVFSIINDEWPEVKSTLIEKIRSSEIIKRAFIPKAFPFTFVSPDFEVKPAA